MRIATALALQLCVPLIVGGAPSLAAERCPAPASMLTPAHHLERFAAALPMDRPVEILVVGTATTNGQDGSGGNAYPDRMLRALQAASPSTRFQLTVRGGKGLTAAEMLPLIEAELHDGEIPLVIWQTGTVEAARGLPPAGLRTVLQAGAAAVHAAGGDLVLVDPPFSHLLRSHTDVEPYEHVLTEAADLPGAVLFHRSDLMREWIREGQVDFEGAAKTDRQSTLEALHDCLGAALAQFLLRGAGPS